MMTEYEFFIFVLCIIVIGMFMAIFGWLLASNIKKSIKLIELGAEDDELIKEHNEKLNKKKSCIWQILDMTLSLVIAGFLLVSFIFSVSVNIMESTDNDRYSLRVVKSGSMAEKNTKNEYLYKDKVNNQIQTFDLIVVHPMPEEKDLQKYDVVVYEVDDILVVHRIVGIEEPDASHPDERYFLLQGDAISSPDRFPVKYSQMRGIYKDQRIPFVGSFITFMQSPAGWICIIIVMAFMIASPIIEKKTENAKKRRLIILGVIVDENTSTNENVVECAEILDEQNDQNVTTEETTEENIANVTVTEDNGDED